jgi:transcriptional regulator of acetoin/glycerol metabolism
MGTNGKEASSCLRFMESMKYKMEQFMKTGDIVETRVNLTTKEVDQIMPQVFSKLKAGHSITSISNDLGIPRITIYKRIKKHERSTIRKT